MKRFFYDDKDFYMDGIPLKIHSGAIHYFRVPRIHWRDRLLKLKECGFNCVETYVCWNLHEPKEGSFDFTGGLDLGDFLDEAAALGLWSIVRPGPYICAEWEGGGLPSWLLVQRGMQLRCNNVLFLEKAEKYLNKVFNIIKPRLVENGGNVLMVQIENEYGSYSNNKSYLQKLKEIFSLYIPECIFFTADGLDPSMLAAGTIDGILACANFGSETEKNMQLLRNFRPHQPLMCMEFWCGWFDHWGGKHMIRPPEEKTNCIEKFLQNGYSFNIYMFCGGTNFGFMNGMNALDGGKTQATVTSYDYDGFLTESGDRTEAYYALRTIMQKYVEVPPLRAVDSEKANYGTLEFTECADLFENIERIGVSYNSLQPLSMEECGQSYGYILYRTHIEYGGRLILEGLADRAWIYRNGELAGKADRNDLQVVWLSPVEEGASVDVLVENRGRINYGPKLLDRKGVAKILIGGQIIFDFECVALPMDNLDRLIYRKARVIKDRPIFYKAEFMITDVKDSFFKPFGFSSGFVVINGYNIGRFNNTEGPQKTLYVPMSSLTKGKNTVIVFNLGEIQNLSAEFTDKSELG